MLQTKLIDRSDIALVRQISATVYDDVLDAIIIETQIQDIQPLLGEFLFNAIMNNPSAYTVLLNGGSYTYQDNTFQNLGLKNAIVFYAYARLKMFGSAIDTPFSTVEKLEGADSRPISDKTKKDLYQMNRDTAFTVWQSVENYLVRTENELFCKSFGYGRSQAKVNYSLNKIE